MTSPLDRVVVIDTEFHNEQRPGNRPVPVCVCAVELPSGRRHRIWCADDAPMPPNPLPPDAVYVAFGASAEWSCYRALGWQMPGRVIDLYAEFRCLTNGSVLNVGTSLLDAAAHYGCPAMPASHKERMRTLVLTGGPFSAEEREVILDYCMEDVEMTAVLYRRMLPEINVPAALERGRYSKAVARIEWNGIPTDVELLNALRERWSHLRVHLVNEVEHEHRFGIYSTQGDNVSFSYSRFDEFLVREGLYDVWERTSSRSSKPRLDKDYLKQMAQFFPRLEPFRALRKLTASLPTLDPPIGTDGRNRTSIRAFAAKTSRNQPRAREMLMCFPGWLRSVMRADPGHALLYADLSSAEFGIAAALSGDEAMMADYRSGEPYLGLGKRMGVLPVEATRQSHSRERENMKAICLGTQYGMGHRTLARRLGVSLTVAEDLLRLHRRAYPGYWSYVAAVRETAQFERCVWTALDWRLNDAHHHDKKSVGNFPMQATCADILRLACCLATEGGLEVGAPFHDAMLVHVRQEDAEAALEFVSQCWTRASEALLGGFALRSDLDPRKTVYEYPRPYIDGRQMELFNKAAVFVGMPDRAI